MPKREEKGERVLMKRKGIFFPKDSAKHPVPNRKRRVSPLPLQAKRPPPFSQNSRSFTREGSFHSVTSPFLNHSKETKSEARPNLSLFQARLTCRISSSPPMAPLFILSPPFPPGRRRTQAIWEPPPPSTLPSDRADRNKFRAD